MHRRWNDISCHRRSTTGTSQGNFVWCRWVNFIHPMHVSTWIIILLVINEVERVLPLPLSPKKNVRSESSGGEYGLTRRGLLYWPVGIGGAIVYGQLVADAVRKLSRGDVAYPEAHEHRVEEMISKTLLTAIPSSPSSRALRILEVGIGKDCRLIQRGLYGRALEHLSQNGVVKIELKAVDISVPGESVIDAASLRLKQKAAEHGIHASLEVLETSITSQLNFPDGWFDAILCSLTLCSVDDQDAAIQEIKRLTRPSGGTFGYVEHVAVNSEESYRLLELQQVTFDPLQNLVADNCHLHRYTDDNIAKIFEVDTLATGRSSVVYQERFLVDDMWPVSCQACGVIQRNA